jgi:hypothetical protein
MKSRKEEIKKEKKQLINSKSTSQIKYLHQSLREE